MSDNECRITRLPNPIKLRSKKWTLTLKYAQVEGFTVENGKEIPNGLSFWVPLQTRPKNP